MARVDDFERFVFIVGAPRCGTTTLSHFLKEHPAVSFPIVKEPHFFAQNDLRDLSDDALRSRVERDYLGRFFHGGARGRVGADASVSYLYTPEQLEPVVRLWPDSRFIVALRNPLTMLPSLHQRLIYLGIETIGRFEEAWAAIPARLAGRKLPRNCDDARWLRYDEAGRFATYLERLFAVVGRKRCMVVVLDDLAADPALQYRRLMQFAGLEPVRTSEFTARRAGYGVRLRWLQRMLKRPAVRMRQLLAGETFGQAAGSAKEPKAGIAPGMILSLRKRLLRWNRIAVSPAPIPAAVHREICGHFEPEVARLTDLIGRDVSHWLRQRPEPRPSEDRRLRPARENIFASRSKVSTAGNR